MAAIGIVLHHGRASELAGAVVAWLTERDHVVRVSKPDGITGELAKWACSDEEFVAGLDLALSLGGDGTMLRAMHLACAVGTPVLGVNAGHLGYLTEVEEAEVYDALERFFAGDYTIDERMTLEVRTDDGGPYASINEAVLQKTSPDHTVRLAVAINGRPFFTAAADGMIVATPTGSTAYNLSARGPIVSPRHRALILTPVAPHMLFDRSLVLDPGETVTIEVLDGPPASLSVDGRGLGQLDAGGSVTCIAGERSARLVRFGDRDFHQILKTKFKLADR